MPLTRELNHLEAAVLLLQGKIAKHQVEWATGECVLGLFRRNHRGGLVTVALEQKLVREKHGCFVVDHENGFSCRHQRTTGKSSLKMVPLLCLLRNLMRPPWFSTMPRTIHKPSPVPFSPFVLTNGSKTVGSTDGGIPVPVSATMMRTQPCTPSGEGTWRVRTINCPPSGMLSFAFTTRLDITWRNWSADPTTCGSFPSLEVTLMFDRSNWRANSVSVSSMTVFTSMVRTWSDVRYRPSIWRTMRATRSVSPRRML